MQFLHGYVRESCKLNKLKYQTFVGICNNGKVSNRMGFYVFLVVVENNGEGNNDGQQDGHDGH